jgi:5,10-methenyltetrahydrofolate synthetase
MQLSPDLSEWRRAQRAALLAQRMAIAPSLRSAWNARITEALLDALVLDRSVVVAAYWPFKGEFDPRFALRVWRDAGVHTALPVVVGKAMPLQFRIWWPGMRTSPGVYGLPIPDEGAIVRPDVVLMPPVGFDAIGYRLGYGGGYYDRTLAALSPQPLKIGVAFELSRIETIRPRPHDIPMDYVVTQQGIWHAGPSGMTLVAGRIAVEPRR